MALRWALERLHSLEKAKAELSGAVERESAARGRLDEEVRALKGSLALRAREAEDREAYYSKLEGLLSSHLTGGIDASALAKREVEAERLREFLETRQQRLESEHRARSEKLELEYRRKQAALEEDALARVRRAEEAVAQRQETLDSAHAIKAVELAEGEVRLKAREAALSDREKNFTEFYRSQRDQLDREISAFQDEVKSQTDFRVAHAERWLEGRKKMLEAAWVQEKGALLADLEDWRRKAAEQTPRLLELESRLADSERSAGQANLRADAQARRFEDLKAAWEAEKEGLLAELRRWWQPKAEQSLARMLTLEKRAAEAEEQAKRSQDESARLTERLRRLEARDAELEGEYQRRVADLEADHKRLGDSLARRREDLAVLHSAFSERFKSVDDESHGRDLIWKKREEDLRHRDSSWHQRLRQWEDRLQKEQGQLEKLKDELTATIAIYKDKLGRLGGT